MEISDTIERKFIDTIDINDWEIETDSGWHSISKIYKTIKYEEWKLELENGMFLICADTHIVFDENLKEIFVKDLKKHSLVMTKNGPIPVSDVYKSDKSSNMYDLSVEHIDHRFYTNGILSHNTTSASVIILHYILFNEHKTVALLANKADAAREILDRIQIAYQSLPKWLQQGVVEWNKGSIEIENGCKVIASASSSSAIRRKISSLFVYR